MKIKQVIGENIAEARKELGINQSELARMIDYSRASIANIETGNQSASIELLFLLAFVLEKDISFFFNSVSNLEDWIPKETKDFLKANHPKEYRQIGVTIIAKALKNDEPNNLK